MTMQKFIILLVLTGFISCTQNEKSVDTSAESSIEKTMVSEVKLTSEEANRLIQLPLKCIQQHFPNKPNYTLDKKEDLQAPHAIHPAFYGCYDWHSAVHGHWVLVKLLKLYPDLPNGAKARGVLATQLTKDNIATELAYFQRKSAKGFERTYGWAWLLQLQNELDTWEDEEGQELASNLRPLSNHIVEKYIDFLPRLRYPIRVGEHTNTAFGLSMAYDYAKQAGKTTLQQLIHDRAMDFYGADKQCPLSWEPSGYDFLSPCLEEANLMSKIMEKDAFQNWLADFLPQLSDQSFALAPAEVSDRTDGKLVHLDGLNFSRAWCLKEIAKHVDHSANISSIANTHINHSLGNIVDGDYAGEHWLASFALYALTHN